LALAVAVESDRTGKVYLDGLMPDEFVRTDWATFGTDDDPLLRAAVAWLGVQGPCAASVGDSGAPESRDAPLPLPTTTPTPSP
jgi:hypothetical protein